MPRFRGCGLPKGRYPVWMPNLRPGEESLRGFRSRISWAESRSRYLTNIVESASVGQRNPALKNHGYLSRKFTLRLSHRLAANTPVAPMCQCPEGQVQFHRHVFQELLRRQDPACGECGRE